MLTVVRIVCLLPELFYLPIYLAKLIYLCNKTSIRIIRNFYTIFVNCKRDGEKSPGAWITIGVLVNFLVVIIFGYLKDFLIAIGMRKKCKLDVDNRENFVPIYNSFENFYRRNVYRYACDIFNQPIAGMAAPIVDIVERESIDFNTTFRFTGNIISAINMSSYNYLAMNCRDGKIANQVEQTIRDYGVAISSTSHEFGTTKLHRKLENLVAEFLGTEDAIIFGMGFATNSTSIPALAGPGCLIFSDEYNHSSIVAGCRLSGATVRVFKHNDAANLEDKMATALRIGQPESGRAWRKIIIIIEGIYSMEGTIANINEFIEIKKKYKSYLYLDEAHSIGALGKRGRGALDYHGANANDVDMLMGTFTKSFAASGGYIAGSKVLIDHLRIYSHGACYGTAMSPVIVQQIISSMEVLMARDGTDLGERKIRQLSENTHYFRRRLEECGYWTVGSDDSPVVPVMAFMPAKLRYFVSELRKLGVACCAVGFPATSLTGGRIRFCLSAGHTREMLDTVIDRIDRVGSRMAIKYS